MKTSTLATILVAVLLLSNTMAASQTRPNTARPVAEKKLATPDFVPKALPEATVNGLRRWGLTESEWLDPSTIKFPSKANAAYFPNDERYKELFVSAERGLDPVASVIVFLNWRPTVMNASTTVVASPLSNNGRAAQAYDRTVGVTNAVDVPAAELEVAANPGRYDPKKYQLLETAAEAGDPIAMYHFGLLLMGNTDATIDRDGQLMMQKAAERGVTDAMTLYAQILYSKQNSTVARVWAKHAAERGDTDAMQILASDLESGRNGAPNLVAATSWLKRAAEAGNVTAMVGVGIRLESGQGIAKNERAAVVWYRRAAEAQHTTGMVKLGIALSQGIGVEQNEAAAVGWFRRAAEQEDHDAMALLGLSLRYGVGVDKNESAAAGWFLRAARADQPLAMIELAEMLEIGIDRRTPEPQAAKYWYDKALGNSESLSEETKAKANDASVALEGRGIRALTPLEMLGANGVRPRSECNAIPKKLRNFNIERAYPQRALDLGQEGKVVAKVGVAADGTVAEVRILSAVPVGVFEASVEREVRRMLYDTQVTGCGAELRWADLEVVLALGADPATLPLIVEVGAFKNRNDATAAIARFAPFFPTFANSEVSSVERRDGVWYSARFGGLGSTAAREACNLVIGRGGVCTIVGD